MFSEIKYTKDHANLSVDDPRKNDYYTILLCDSGSANIKIGFHEFELKPHGIAILSPNTIFSISRISSDLNVKQIFFTKPFLQKIFIKEDIVEELLLLNSNYPPFYELHNRFDIVLNRFLSLERELNTQYAYHLDIARLMVIEILYEYNRACEYCLLGFEKNMNRNYQLTYEFKKLVDERFSSWNTIGFYASHFGISAKHLTEVVKAETGHTALQIIHERLLLESQYLLKHTTLSIKECAHILGFESASYFSRFFKSHTSASPIAFRKENP
ncbi:AraC family transcriptional regulator [Sphingobacterium tabacisoli]|uniref:Helix-turn-helix domain-containing protein n=1 Tax=Sphingobacterium tabacisoli TaxID=2044855 RepID=A0ABW5L3M4_9SPHI|nr:helix-turn-helix domain-containing protein [Sphingobacterium tabacisoli]